jgi:predicted transposase YbfD/YdcC
MVMISLEALQRQVGDRWTIESWRWIHNTQLHEDSHRCRGNGAGVMATLRTAAFNLLSPSPGFSRSEPACRR